MKNGKLYIVMVGLPARGKSTIAVKLKENLVKDAVETRIFNNGNLRRQLLHHDTSDPNFFAPDNQTGLELREHIAEINMRRAKKFLVDRGRVAILDATNVRMDRRIRMAGELSDHPLLFLECVNNDDDILEASIQRKVRLSEFDHLAREAAVENFKQRIRFYEDVYTPLIKERNIVKLDSLNNKILQEEITDDIPYYDLIRDLLVSDSVKNLYLIRHGETFFNLENRLGGDSELTERGWDQARQLAAYFRNKKIPVIFTSSRVRTVQTAAPIANMQKSCAIIPLDEFSEIDAGICEGMSYEEIKRKMPHVYYSRKLDKYSYVYPKGEGYSTMKERIHRGIKKALYLSNNPNNLVIVGHQAVNRMILSHFLYRRTEDVPFIYIPQDKFYHIVAVQNKKLFELKRY